MLPVGEAYPEKKNAIASLTHSLTPRAPSWAPHLNARAEGSVDLEVALLAERRARGRDGQRMRSPQLARCSRDQTRLRMAALARD